MLSLTTGTLPPSVVSAESLSSFHHSACSPYCSVEVLQREPKRLYTNLVGILEIPPLQFRIPLVLRLAYVCSTACNPSSTSSSWNKTRAAAAAANDSLAAAVAAVAVAADPAVSPSPPTPTPSMTAAAAAPKAGAEAAASGKGAEKREVGISSGFRFGDGGDDDDDEEEDDEEEEEEEGDEADPGCLLFVGPVASLGFFRVGDA